MLIHHLRHRPVRGAGRGSVIARPVMQRRRRETRVESSIALAHADDGLLRLRNRLHVGPDLQRRQQARFIFRAIGLRSRIFSWACAVRAHIVREIAAGPQDDFDRVSQAGGGENSRPQRRTRPNPRRKAGPACAAIAPLRGVAASRSTARSRNARIAGSSSSTPS